MHSDMHEHHPLCAIELVSGEEASRCPGAQCAFWERGCVLARIEPELEAHPEVARLLLDLRRRLEADALVAA